MSDLSLTAIRTIFSDSKTSFTEKRVKGSEVVLNKKGNPIFRQGNQCGVTKIRYSTGEVKALRLWQNEAAANRNIYEQFSKYIDQFPAPYLLRSHYLSKAVYFNGEYFPALLMDWCDGISLKEYLDRNINDSSSLAKLKGALFEMFSDMNKRGISHGDIHHNNIYISDKGTPILIDYDSVFVPSLTGTEDICLGYSGFQHPTARGKNKYLSSKTDYFSQLIVILTIECIIQKPSLWSTYLDEDDTVSLLLKEKDFLNLKSSIIYSDIKSLKGDVPFLLNVLEQYLQKDSIDELWPYYETITPTQTLFCIYCGHKIPESTDKYCTNCGALINV